MNNSFVDYRLPTALDIPDCIDVISITSSPAAFGPLGVKRVGEAPVLLPPSVIADAVFDAIWRRPRELPITAERVLELLESERRP